MPNAVAIRSASEPVRVRDFNPSQLALIRRTVAADCNHDEFDLYIEVARRVGLDPFRRQIYAIVHSKDNPEKRKLTIITGIDGFRAVAARNRDYRPDDEEPTIVYDTNAKDPDINPLGIVKATVKAYKLAPDGQWFPVVGTAYWSEFAPIKDEWAWDDKAGKRQPTGKMALDATSLWRKMPHVLLPKCAEAQALRKGWPEDLSGIYAPEEMEQATVLDITPSAEIEQFEQQKRLQLVGATRSVPIIWKVGEPVVYVPAGELGDKAAEHIAASDIAAELKWWWETNTAGFREFWAISKSDGLGVKKLYEDRLKALEAA